MDRPLVFPSLSCLSFTLRSRLECKSGRFETLRSEIAHRRSMEVFQLKVIKQTNT